MSRRIVLIAVIPIAWIGFALNFPPSPVTQVIGREPARPEAAMVGSSSCSASGCHGGGKPTTLGSEWNTWIDRDPHAKAYRVLFDETSRWIAKNLNGGAVPAHENRTCLKCHAPSGSPHLLPDGVSCESCHGAAQKYESLHYLPFWKGLSGFDKASLYGLTQTKSLSVRVGECAACHVGTDGQQVDHTLIAAGHPRLLFEYSSSHHNPQFAPHWKEKDADFEMRSWLVGQIATAKASLNLLAGRASPQSAGTWPELAEFNCYACHLSLTNSKGKAPSPARSIEAIPRSEWSYSLLPVLAANVPALRAISPKTDLLEKMQHLVNERPGLRAEVAASARETIVELDRWLAALEQPGASLSNEQANRLTAAIVEHLAGPDGGLKTTDWDRLAQHYLAVSQWYFARVQKTPTAASPPLAKALREVGAQLHFKEGTNSPRPLPMDKQADSWQRLRQIISPSASQP